MCLGSRVGSLTYTDHIVVFEYHGCKCKEGNLWVYKISSLVFFCWGGGDWSSTDIKELSSWSIKSCPFLTDSNQACALPSWLSNCAACTLHNPLGVHYRFNVNKGTGYFIENLYTFYPLLNYLKLFATYYYKLQLSGQHLYTSRLYKRKYKIVHTWQL